MANPRKFAVWVGAGDVPHRAIRAIVLANKAAKPGGHRRRGHPAAPAVSGVPPLRDGLLPGRFSSVSHWGGI